MSRVVFRSPTCRRPRLLDRLPDRLDDEREWLWRRLPVPSNQKTSNANANSNSEEAAVFERILNRVRFENDGTEVSETEAVVRIQSQAGVEEFGQLVFGYSSATEKLEVEYVRVRKPDGQVVVTPESTAQDFAPDVLKEAPMYSDYRQRHISVAALQPGDTLEYRTVIRVLTPLAAGNFWYEYTFPKGVVVNEDRLEIDIPKSREVKLKTPTRKAGDSGDRRPPHLHLGGEGYPTGSRQR